MKTVGCVSKQKCWHALPAGGSGALVLDAYLRCDAGAKTPVHSSGGQRQEAGLCGSLACCWEVLKGAWPASPMETVPQSISSKWANGGTLHHREVQV